MSLSSQNENDPWVELVSVHEVEAWLAFQNQELARLLENKASVGQGLCLQLKLGGEIFCHTNQEGEILLELSDEALWCIPVISKATNCAPPRAQLWQLPNDVLIQLIFGLNSLISSSRLVLSHRFKVEFP